MHYMYKICKIIQIICLFLSKYVKIHVFMCHMCTYHVMLYHAHCNLQFHTLFLIFRCIFLHILHNICIYDIICVIFCCMYMSQNMQSQYQYAQYAK
jgi:hypothetical protein